MLCINDFLIRHAEFRECVCNHVIEDTFLGKYDRRLAWYLFSSAFCSEDGFKLSSTNAMGAKYKLPVRL